MLSVRDKFFHTIFDMIRSGEDIYVVSADLGAPSLDDLRKYFPERFINVGIAEQSLISVSAGLIVSGKKVVAYGLNPFPVTRSYDQIRCLMGELKIPLTLCALNSGICSAEAGYTHMAVEVFNMMRCVPGVHTFNPSDETLSEMLAKSAGKADLPKYIIFDKAAKGILYDKNELDINKGYAIYQPSKKSSAPELIVVTCGSFIPMIRKIAELYAERKISVKVIDMFSFPVDEKNFLEDVQESSMIITLEENILSGGLGSYVLEMLSDNQINIPVKRYGLKFDKGVPSVFMSRDYMRRQQRLDEAEIISAIDFFIGGHKFETQR